MIEHVKNKAKGKVKKKMMSLLLAVLPNLLIVLLVGGGVFALFSFVQSLFKKDEARIEADLDSMTLEEILVAVEDEDIITEETLDNMMIERDTLKAVLQGVYDYNHKDIMAEKSIEYIHTYTVYEEVEDEESGETEGESDEESGETEGESDEESETEEAAQEGEEEKETQVISKVVTERGMFPYEVHSSTYEDTYQMDWQVAYALAIFYAIELYGEDPVETEESEDAEVNEVMDEVEELTEEVEIEEEQVYTTGDTSYYESPYDDFFVTAVAESGVPLNLLKSLADTYTAFDPDYVDSTGRRKGIMSLTDVVVEQYGLENVFDPETNILVGAKYLSSLLQRYSGDIPLALAAYDAGTDAVESDTGERSIPDNYSVKTRVNRVLTKFTGLSYYTVNAHLDEYILNHTGLKKFGSFANGRLSLSSEEVEMLLYDLEPNFLYYFDVVRDEKTSYTFEECAALPNDGLISFGDPNTETGYYEYYEPHSLIDMVELANRDVIYHHDNNQVESTTVYMREERWQTIELKYWPNYDDVWLSTFIAELPKGKEVLAKYQAEVATIDSSEEGGNFYSHTSNPYEDIPIGSNGMTRQWSMSENDRYLISLSAADTWNLLIGHGFTSSPSWGTYQQAWVPIETIKVPIWTWASNDANDFTKVPTWKTLTVNAHLASTYKHIFADIYNDPSQPVIIPEYTAAFCFRSVRGASKSYYSSHSFGTAIDINWNTSIPGTKWTHALVKGRNALPSKSEWQALPETKAKYELLYRDCPIVCIFKAYGFDWGADWSSKSDGMHFSFIGDRNKTVSQANHETYYR